MEPAKNGERPLLGFTILDLADEAAVFGPMLLAELGATVIRVEDANGDALRRRGPFLHNEEGLERSLAHLLYNAGKLSVALDLERAASWDVVRRIAKAVDVVVAPLERRPQVRELIADAAAAGTGVVDVVFRRGAPEEVATDLVATAAGGLLTLNGFPEDPPNHPAGQLGYKECGLAVAHAAVALVMERRRGAGPGVITVSLQEAVNFTTIQTSNANWWHWQDRVPSRMTPLSPFTTHLAGDGRWVSFTIHPPNWPRYAEWATRELDAPELRDEAWNNAAYRAQNVRTLANYTRRLCALYPRDELIAEGQARGLLVLPVNSVPDIAEDKHLVARGFVESVEHRHIGAKVRMPRSAFLSTAHASKALPAPALGQHTAQVLADVAGLDATEMDRLFDAGIAAGVRTSEPAFGGSLTTPKPAAGARPSRRKPLEGFRVLDFCWAIAGPLGTRLLADMGADVIKVESEYRLDPIRQIGVQPKGEASWNTNGQFNDCNTSKRSLVLNLNTPEGIEIARKLAATADVVTSNYTPDRLDKWGLGYDALRAIKPDIIVANIAVMGISGPHKDWRSYGSGIVAMCGLADRTGFPGRDPIGLGTLHTDFTVPYFAATQIMAALLHRERTGEGQYLELAQYEASVHLLDTELVEYLNNGEIPDRDGNRSRWMAPHGVFPAEGEDRWVAIACRDDREWDALRGVMGLEQFAGVDRLACLDEIEAAIAHWTQSRDRWEAARLLQDAGVPASPVEDLFDLLHNDDAMRSDYRELPLPSGVSAIVQEQPITWDGERVPFTRAPLWGEHTDEILRTDLGLDDAAIASLAERNVLF